MAKIIAATFQTIDKASAWVEGNRVGILAIFAMLAIGALRTDPWLAMLMVIRCVALLVWAGLTQLLLDAYRKFERLDHPMIAGLFL